MFHTKHFDKCELLHTTGLDPQLSDFNALSQIPHAPLALISRIYLKAFYMQIDELAHLKHSFIREEKSFFFFFVVLFVALMF